MNKDTIIICGIKKAALNVQQVFTVEKKLSMIPLLHVLKVIIVH